MKELLKKQRIPKTVATDEEESEEEEEESEKDEGREVA